MKNEDYISNQIAVYKNSKTLVEFQDKLKSAGIHSYAHIHANGEIDADGRKRYSLIGILMKDYSKGTGDKAVTVSANLSPEQVKFFLSRIEACVESYSFLEEKIFGSPDKDGYAQVTKFKLIRATKDAKGNVRKLPWYIEVENGKGIPVQNANGGTYMKPNSFVSTGKAYANMSDLDLYECLSRVCSGKWLWHRTLSKKQKKNWLTDRKPHKNGDASKDPLRKESYE
jgi:hypothetical protein